MYHVTTLRNGVQLVLAPRQETKAATILILYHVGSRFEPKALNGSSHFIEHLMFKGTKKRPTTLSISKELDGVGAEYNAFTAKDHTGYYIKLAADDIPLAVDILEDMLSHSLFQPKEIDRERKVVAEEINMYEDNPTMLIEDLFEQAFYGDHPLGRMIAGPKSIIHTVTRERLLRYRDQFYLPSNMLIAAAGRFAVQPMLTLLSRAFSRTSSRRRAPRFQPFRKTVLPLRCKVKTKETEQTHLMLGFPGVSYFDRDLNALTLLSIILGATMSSRLFISIRERQGLCYMIRSGVTLYEDTGNVGIMAGLDTSRLEPALAGIMKEVVRIKEKPVTREELHRAKEFYRGKLVLNLEDSEELANWIGKQQLLTRKIETPEQRIRGVLQVTAADIQRVAHRVFRLDRLAGALIGPVKDGATLQQAVRRAIRAVA